MSTCIFIIKLFQVKALTVTECFNSPLGKVKEKVNTSNLSEGEAEEVCHVDINYVFSFLFFYRKYSGRGNINYYKRDPYRDKSTSLRERIIDLKG